MSKFDMEIAAGAISDEFGLVSDGRILSDLASTAIIEPTRTTPEEYDASIMRFYPETLEEVIPLVPVQDVTITIAEAAYRGENVLDAGFKQGNDSLRNQAARGLALPSLLQDIANAGGHVVDETGAVIDQPSIKQVEDFLRDTGNGDFFDTRMEQFKRVAVERFGKDFLLLHQFNGFRHISFVEGLADELRGHEVDTGKFINPENYPAAEIQLLNNTIAEAGPCIRETDMVALGFDKEEQEAGHAKCEQLGREIGQILAGAEVAANENEPDVEPASMGIFGIPMRIANDEKSQQSPAVRN